MKDNYLNKTITCIYKICPTTQACGFHLKACPDEFMFEFIPICSVSEGVAETSQGVVTICKISK